MAGTYLLTVDAKLTNGSHKELFKPGQQTINQTGQGQWGIIQTIGTSAEAITPVDIGTLGRCEVQNLDATNFVNIGPDSGGSLVPFIKLKPGEVHVFRLTPGITIKAQADTASCKVWIRIYED